MTRARRTARMSCQKSNPLPGFCEGELAGNEGHPRSVGILDDLRDGGIAVEMAHLDARGRGLESLQKVIISVRGGALEVAKECRLELLIAVVLEVFLRPHDEPAQLVGLAGDMTTLFAQLAEKLPDEVHRLRSERGRRHGGGTGGPRHAVDGLLDVVLQHGAAFHPAEQDFHNPGKELGMMWGGRDGEICRPADVSHGVQESGSQDSGGGLEVLREGHRDEGRAGARGKLTVPGGVAFDSLRGQGGHLGGRTEHLVDGFLVRICQQLIQRRLATQAQKQADSVRPRAGRRERRMRKLADEPRELPVLGDGVGKSIENLSPQPFPARGLQKIDQGLGGARVVDLAQRPHCGGLQLLAPSREQTGDVDEASRVGEDPYRVQGGQGHLSTGVVQVCVQPLQPLAIPVESGNQAMGGLERLNCQGQGFLPVCSGYWSRLRLEQGGIHDPTCSLSCGRCLGETPAGFFPPPRGWRRC